MSYVCEVLQTVDNVQTCVQWSEHKDVLPNLTVEQACYIGGLILLTCVCAFSFRLLGDFIKSFK